ncbi:hypothetical protein AVEN_71062-1, partial [Araneus ventricosus]
MKHSGTSHLWYSRPDGHISVSHRWYASPDGHISASHRWYTSPDGHIRILNVKTTSPIARDIQALLYTNEDIRLGWVKSHAGRIGNEMADMLAKEAITSNQSEKSLFGKLEGK